MNINWDFVFLILFVIVLYLFYRANKSKFEVQSKFFFIYKSKIGIKLMNKIGKWPKWILHTFSVLGITTGFAGMLFMTYTLVYATYKFVVAPSLNPPVLSPVIPGVNIPGVGVISFFHWIIAIFAVATIHEFSHGFIARFFKIKVKASGFLFFGPILGAFVEPDEKQLSKSSTYTQLSIFSAGPFSNILIAFVFLWILILITPPITNMYNNQIEVVSVDPIYPASSVGMQAGEKIIAINNQIIKNVEDFSDVLNKTKPFQKINIQTNLKNYSITLAARPENKDQGFLGIKVQYSTAEIKPEIKQKYGSFIPNALMWISALFKWLFLVSLGIALFNLLPMGPLDGGRMFLTALIFIFKDEKKAKRVWATIGIFLLGVIIINLLPLLKDLLLFLLSPFI